MKIFPAIDLFDGCAVRLTKGDYGSMKIYSRDPASLALRFCEAGAKNLHLVDLQGAKDGSTPAFELVRGIKRETGLFCEIGGGIRTEAQIERYLNAGVDRVILGTAAVEDEALLRKAAQYGDRIAVGADLKNGLVAVRGWTETTALGAEAFLNRLDGIGIRAVICTDIGRDGMLSGVDVGFYRALKAAFGGELIASGGITEQKDLAALDSAGIDGAVIGKALYENRIDLKRVLEEYAC